jgi:GT2 family glycosyltransferase
MCRVISFVSLDDDVKAEFDAVADDDAGAGVDQASAETGSGPSPIPLCPSGSMCVFGGLYFLSVGTPEITTLPTTVQLDGNGVPGPLLATRRGARFLIAGQAPAFLEGRDAIRTVGLSTSNRQAILRFDNHPLPVRTGDEALTTLLDLLGEPDRGAVLSFVLRVVSSLVGHLDAALTQLVRTILKTCADERDARVHALDGQHLYWRVALPPGSGDHGAVAVRCFFLYNRELIQVSCGKALRTACGGLHLLSRKPSIAANGRLIVALGSVILTAAVRPAPRDPGVSTLATILSGQPDDPKMVTRYLLSRCAELYRGHKSAEVRALGDCIWAQTPFSPRTVVRPDLDFGASIECILPVPGKGLLIIGWLLDPHRLLEHLEVVDGQGRLGTIKAPLFRYERPDVLEAFPDLGGGTPGFITFHPCAAARDLWPTFQVKGVLKGGGLIDFATDVKASRRMLSSAEALLGLVPAEKAMPELFRHLAPAVGYLQARKAAQSKTRRVLQFLARIEQPAITVVVPIYKRLDHARHQLAQFAADPAFAAIELIYVLDAPELEGAFAAQLDAWCRLYRRPASLAVMRQNCGFAGATNAGARLGRGRFLVLMNSDVIPAAPGWVQTMQRVLEADETIGATGARLLYEDGAVQHAGMTHVCDSTGAWKVVHPGKGLHAELPSRHVSGVTAACMMMPSDLYGAVGGLSEDYVIGDFEDSDLCLKIRGTGKSIWFCAEAVLYHLERQSMGGDSRHTPAIRRYNRALHQNRWAAVLATASG